MRLVTLFSLLLVTALQAEIKRRTQQGDKKASAYLERERGAAGMDPYFRSIISGGYPSVPES